MNNIALKRFLLFAGDEFYPGGGWDDFIAGYDTELEAIRVAEDNKFNWYHVVDTYTGEKTE